MDVVLKRLAAALNFRLPPGLNEVETARELRYADLGISTLILGSEMTTLRPQGPSEIEKADIIYCNGFHEFTGVTPRGVVVAMCEGAREENGVPRLSTRNIDVSQGGFSSEPFSFR